MTGLAAPAPLFALGYDCLAPLSRATVRALMGRGAQWFGRYLETLTLTEVDDIHGEGAGILLLTEARAGALDGPRGAQVGAQSVARAVKLLVPPRVHIVIDLEATGDNSRADVANYVNLFAEGITVGGYDDALYVGGGQPLGPAELYGLKPDRYGRAGSLGIPEVPCGFSWLQLYPLDQTIDGQRVDAGILQSDFRGRVLTLWWPDGWTEPA